MQDQRSKNKLKANEKKATLHFSPESKITYIANKAEKIPEKIRYWFLLII